jgi:phage terminase small subunit
VSRKGKKRDERQKATSTPPSPKVRRCDDELTTLAEQLRPAHRRFADGYLAGQPGARAAADAGFSEASARSIAYRLLRRPDVRRYIHLAQREHAVASRVTIDAIVDRLWRTVTDEAATAKSKDLAMRHLVRIMVARGRGAGGEDDVDPSDGRGLTDEKAAKIESMILGVKR